jgi:hypothetical protein
MFDLTEILIIQNHSVPRSDLVPGDWIPTKEDQPRYLRIEADNPSLVNESMPFRERLQFWRKKFIEK